jgi:hypothetical protein
MFVVSIVWSSISLPNLIGTRPDPFDFRILLGSTSLARGLRIKQLLPLGTVERALGLAGRFLDLARFDESLLSLIILAGGCSVSFAFIISLRCWGPGHSHVLPR